MSPCLGSSSLATGRTSRNVNSRAMSRMRRRSSVMYGSVTALPILAPDQIRPTEADHRTSGLVTTFGMPCDDAEARTGGRGARRYHGAVGSDRITHMDGLMVSKVVHAEKIPANLAQVFDTQAKGSEEHQERIDGFSLVADLLGQHAVEVDRIVVEACC